MQTTKENTMETTTETRTENEKALERREKIRSLNREVKAGAWPRPIAERIKANIRKEEAAAPFLIRGSFDSMMMELSMISGPGECWRVGQNMENQLTYAWRERLADPYWEPGEAEGVTFTDEDGLGIESAFVNVISANFGG